jgi:hypothetical protein
MNDHAFTRLEAVAVAGGLSVLGILAVAVRADMASNSDRVVCVNNLRQISRGFNMWAADHGGVNPWALEVNYGGLRNPTTPFVIAGVGNFPAHINQNIWFQFFWIRDELQTPSVLACPADVGAKRARDFSTAPGMGFANLGFQNAAVSYFISTHAIKENSAALLSGDRNIMTSRVEGCPTGLTVSGFSAFPPPDIAYTGWTNRLHVSFGNTAFSDGSVRTFSSPQLRRALSDERSTMNAELNPSAYHLLLP